MPVPRVIVALDVPALRDAEQLVARLGDDCNFYKVGSALFTAEGPRAVERLRARGKDVFLDLKFHDIPNTVCAAARHAAALGTRLLTVHATGGRAMMEAAVDGAGETCGVLAVTVLTSLDATALGQIRGQAVPDVRAEVLRLAGLAHEAGVAGIVCSGHEARDVHERFGASLTLLVPGIRLDGGAANDQARVVTPQQAMDNGASYLVLGRAITQSPDPAAALAQIHRALHGARHEDR
ncbi:MAG TPA: orotidine-5'-phosphate decarboxylase [Gemmatimonadaceae bacterium]|nr:orotidine-5'-phosphate decarboxylase [Gemmatimonadaceae bacterium]